MGTLKGTVLGRCAIPSDWHSRTRRGAQKRTIKRQHRIIHEKEGRKNLEFLNFKFSIRTRLFLTNAGTAVLKKKILKNRTNKNAGKNKMKKTREKSKFLIVTIRHNKKLNWSRQAERRLQWDSRSGSVPSRAARLTR